MNKEKLRIRFDGPAMSEHCMDVSVLGPSLTGLGELLRSANKNVNGGEVNVQVVMNADVEANCVTLDFSVLQGWYDSIKQLLGTEHVKTAKDILEWVGLIAGGAGSMLTVWKVYQWIVKNREPGQTLTSTKEGGTVVITISGNNNTVRIGSPVYALASDPNVQASFRELLSPLKQDGIEEATFIHGNQEVVITKEEARPVLEASPADLDLEIDPQIIKGHIVIHAPTFDQGAKNWKFKWNGRVETIDISRTNIAATIVERGKVVIGDAFEVRMEVIEKRLKSGYKQYFKVLEVLKFKPNPETQLDLPTMLSDDE